MFEHQLLSAAALSVAATSACGHSSSESHYVVVDRLALLSSVEAGE
jgi:hypothetical protein